MFSKAAMHEPISYQTFQVLYWTGIRIGELLALTFDDIDSEKSIIAIPDTLRLELLYFKEAHCGKNPGSRVFSTSKSHLAKHSAKQVVLTGVNPIRLHDLGHSHVSHLIELGFSAVAIAERLGHKTSIQRINMLTSSLTGK